MAFAGDAGDLLAVLADLQPVLLDSGGRGTSMLALGRRWSCSWRTGDPGDPLEAVRSRLQAFSAPAHDRWPFTGGLVGWFGYDLRLLLERLPDRHPAPPRCLPDLFMADCRLVVLLDEQRREAALARLRGGGDEEGDDRLERRVLERLEQGLPPPPVSQRLPVAIPPKSAHEARVRHALESIAAGDIYQVNLSQRFTAARPRHLVDCYRRLRRENPPAFGGYAEVGGEALLCLSPERFLRVDAGRVQTRPVKGTAPRSDDAARDARLARSLEVSVKDRAELAMIVDVLRNDLSRVCIPGSVVVTQPMTLETHPTVHHLVAGVEGRLEPGADAVDLVRATLPGGSITGAPRIRAMEIIDELETCRRGVYTGSLGYLGFDGRADLNILIRTAVTEGAHLCFHGGGGIVADSDPAEEYAETLHKVRGILRALDPGVS